MINFIYLFTRNKIVETINLIASLWKIYVGLLALAVLCYHIGFIIYLIPRNVLNPDVFARFINAGLFSKICYHCLDGLMLLIGTGIFILIAFSICYILRMFFSTIIPIIYNDIVYFIKDNITKAKAGEKVKLWSSK